MKINNGTCKTCSTAGGYHAWGCPGPSKSSVTTHFNNWLSIMEQAYSELTAEEFRELEDKIRNEITHYRKNSQAAKGKKND